MLKVIAHIKIRLMDVSIPEVDHITVLHETLEATDGILKIHLDPIRFRARAILVFVRYLLVQFAE